MQVTRFDTAIGPCVMTWSDRGVRAVRLPNATDPASARKAQDDEPGQGAPEWVGRAVQAMTALLAGTRTDLGWIEVDWAELPAFDRQVYAFTRTIPAGRAMTYGEVARAVGAPDAARAVGQALGRNPVPLIVPCHRVLAASGRAGGFSAPGGARSKLKLLAIEGYMGEGPTLFDRQD